MYFVLIRKFPFTTGSGGGGGGEGGGGGGGGGSGGGKSRKLCEAKSSAVVLLFHVQF